MCRQINLTAEFDAESFVWYGMYIVWATKCHALCKMRLVKFMTHVGNTVSFLSLPHYHCMVNKDFQTQRRSGLLSSAANPHSSRSLITVE